MGICQYIGVTGVACEKIGIGMTGHHGAWFDDSIDYVSKGKGITQEQFDEFVILINNAPWSILGLEPSVVTVICNVRSGDIGFSPSWVIDVGTLVVADLDEEQRFSWPAMTSRAASGASASTRSGDLSHIRSQPNPRQLSRTDNMSLSQRKERVIESAFSAVQSRKDADLQQLRLVHDESVEHSRAMYAGLHSLDMRSIPASSVVLIQGYMCKGALVCISVTETRLPQNLRADAAPFTPQDWKLPPLFARLAVKHQHKSGLMRPTLVPRRTPPITPVCHELLAP
ncbi:hypothetical protein K504DRAFT_506411 [Pleomassaria siparia CBS 279.74]|uniref:Uncharacterized protein n=1 Tax=Pleomassaria siparia CBS 279.74 TaxID=1314801 RepID=A0A6G1JWE9_9PLEO|nr:hypothetical protein K504DRAFT_506411 [Pleomassaria siparia CBS 279.74]